MSLSRLIDPGELFLAGFHVSALTLLAAELFCRKNLHSHNSGAFLAWLKDLHRSWLSLEQRDNR